MESDTISEAPIVLIAPSCSPLLLIATKPHLNTTVLRPLLSLSQEEGTRTNSWDWCLG